MQAFPTTNAEALCRSMADNPNRTPCFRIKTFSSWRELEAIHYEWDRLLIDTKGLSIFSTPEWLGAWWRSFRQDSQLISAAFLDSDGHVAGLAPIYRDTLQGPLGLRIKRLRLVGDGTNDSDNLNLIIRRGDEEACVCTLLDWLKSLSDWTLCELNTLPADSSAVPSLISWLEQLGWTYNLTHRPCCAIELPESWEIYLRQLSSQSRSNVTRYSRRLQAHYCVKISKCEHEKELRGYLEDLFDLHQKRWELRGESGSFAEPCRRKFYQEMATLFLARGWLQLWRLELDGKVAAIQFAFRYGDVVYQLQEGLNPDYHSDKVGHVLRGYLLERWIHERVHRYDYLGGKETHKLQWGAKISNYTDIRFARPAGLGSLYLSLDRRMHNTKECLREYLPASIFAVLRRAYGEILKA